ncbi:MAG: prepilin-type N-terminal cleavage/methylation domain-containing protein [bacterium]
MSLIKTKKGFTLIELLVVIAIIAILAAILFPVFARAREKARQTTCSSNQRQIATSALMYCQDHDESFPATTSFWQNIAVDPGVMVCPTKGKSTPNGYAYNNLLNSKAIGTITDPTKAFISCDSDDVVNVWSVPIDSAKRHSGQCLYSFVDGHVAPNMNSPLNNNSSINGYVIASGTAAIVGGSIFNKSMYFPNYDTTMTTYDFTRTASLDWGNNVAAWTGGPATNFGIVWKAKMAVPVSGSYIFTGQADDCASLKITDPVTGIQTIVYSFTNNSTVSGSINLVNDRLYDFELFYGEFGGAANASYNYTPPSGTSVRMPTSIFYITSDIYGL